MGLNANGGTIASGKDMTSYTYGVGAALPTKDDMTREGYTFDGWYDNNDFSGSSVTMISPTDTGAKAFYAKWTINSYSVTFNSNDGSDIDSQTVDYGLSLIHIFCSRRMLPATRKRWRNGWNSVSRSSAS